MKYVKIQQIRTIIVPCNTDDPDIATQSILAEWDDDHINLVDEDFDDIVTLVKVEGDDKIILHSCIHNPITHQPIKPPHNQ